MLDFLMIATRTPKRDVVEIYPKFLIKKSNDLMIRGSDFYAIWNEESHLWSVEEETALFLIDKALDEYASNYNRSDDTTVKVLHMWDADSGSIDRWHKYCQKQMRDCYHVLDEKLIFSNEVPKKRDYASRVLPYPLEEGPIDAYDELISVLYSPEERHKLEWAIGAIVSGESKHLQKFEVLYGSAGTGKSTVLNIINDLFSGYVSVFDAKALGSATNAFALEAFKSNPLVAIQHDGDLSRIEDNTRLNSVVSHEVMTVNEKFKSTYTNRFNAFLFMGTNKPVKITDAKSGILRRLIDVSPTGKKVDSKRYKELMHRIAFEHGHIASYCKQVYEEDPGYYDDYVPTSMMGASNDFFNFIQDNFDIFEKNDGITLKAAWDLYKVYCEDAKLSYPFSQRVFKEELKNYFKKFEERAYLNDNLRVRNYYSGFMTDKFENSPKQKLIFDITEEETWLKFDDQPSLVDDILKDCPAQYAKEDGSPTKGWDFVKTTLKDIDTKKLHWVQPPDVHIVVDFDIPGPDGKKSRKANIEAASKWPQTYAELSKSGEGVHLHYIYNGDPSMLSSVFDDHIEIKVYTGKSALRRMVTKCNNLPVATISSGLPLKGEANMIEFEGVKNEKALRTMIRKNLNKEYHSSTKSSIDFIFKILEDAYNSGIKYDVSDLDSIVRAFAMCSTHQSEYCYKVYKKMHFKSEEERTSAADTDEKPIIFYDVEVFPNLFVIVYKALGDDKPMVKLINPSPAQVEALFNYRLVGYNCRRYDNHILWARSMGVSIEGLYDISQRIIAKDNSAFFRDAYNLSYTDLYDYASKKQSLKKWEIELGIHHQELGLPWDKPVDESLWPKVADYCCNDVGATEATWFATQDDFLAREILADITGLTVNDTTNTLTGKLIFGNERKPQGDFRWRDLSKPVHDIPDDMRAFLEEEFPEMMAEPHGEAKSILPYFPGYSMESGKSIYRGEEVGEGGLVRALPGCYGRAKTFDVASEHPHSAMAEYVFGKYTEIFRDLVRARVFIKHKDFDSASKLFDGKLKKYLDDPKKAKGLAGALKIAINSVYGLTAASFSNLFRDPNNIDNIVAKRGALFMLDLMYAVLEKGYNVIHIKTDSIKVENPTPEIEEFIYKFGKRYGYSFEVEHVFEKICLVNKAVYIGKLAEDDPEAPGHWEATGAQFAVPYVFKTLFSKEPIVFEDMCETKEVKAGEIQLDFNEDIPQLSPEDEKLLDKLDKAWHSQNPLELEKLQKKLNIDFEDMGALYSELCKKEEATHNLHFVGRVGQFCPMKPGAGGGILYRVQDGKRYAITGSDGYRWMEAEVVKKLGKENDIDKDYYRKLVDEARNSINEFCNIENFLD